MKPFAPLALTLAACVTTPVAPDPPLESLVFDEGIIVPRAYPTLMQAAAQDLDVDWVATRVHFATSDPHYAPGEDVFAGIRERALRQREAENDAAACATVEGYLHDHFVDISGHLLAAELCEEPEASAYQEAYARLLASMTEGSDGHRAQRPIVVIAVEEEDALIASQGIEVTGRRAGECAAGRPCDLVDVLDPASGAAWTLHFDVSLPRGAMAE